MNARVQFILAAMLLVLMAGCSAEHFYGEGVKASARGDYDKAVDNYAKAVAKDPDNPEYRNALASARRQASSKAVDEALRLAAANDLSGAIAQTRRALNYDPGNPDAISLDAELRQRVAGAEQRRSQALSLASQGLFDEAIATMQTALAENRTLPNGQADLQRIRQQAASHWVAQANARLARGELDQADRDARIALGYWPGDPNAQRVIAAVANARRAEQLVQQARAALAGNRFADALAALDQANQLQPGRTDIPLLIQAARIGVFRQHVAEGRRLAAAGDHAAALHQFQLARQVLPGFENIDEMIRQQEVELAGRHRRAADNAFAQQRWGEALVQYLLADAVAPRSVPNNLIAQSADQIRRRLGYPVAVVVGSQRQQIDRRNLDEAIEAGLLRHLSAVQPGPVTVMTRIETQRALARQRLSDDRFFGPRAVDAARSLAGDVGGLVIANITQFEIINTQARTNVTVQVQVGMQQVDNPDYLAAQRARDQALANVNRLTAERDRLQRREANLMDDPPSPARTRNLAEVRRDLVRVRNELASAQAALDAANRTLRNTPAKVQQPAMGDVVIPAMQHTRTMRLLIDVKFIDAATGMLLVDQVVDGSVAATDVTHPGMPGRHVPADPLQLPENAELTRQAILRAVLAVQQSAEAGMFAWPRRYETLAQSAMVSRRFDQAVESLVDRIFVEPVATPATEKAMAELDRLAPHNPSISLRAMLARSGDVLRQPGRLPLRLEERDMGLVVLEFTAAGPGPRRALLPDGLRLPARLVSLDGRPLRSIAAFNWFAAELRPGSRVPLELQDRDQQSRVLVTVE